MSIDTERFSTVPLFEGLDHKEIAELLTKAEDVVATKGDEMVRQGDDGDGFYVIAAGAFEVLKSGAENKVLARLETYSYFGEMSLFRDEKRAASVICVEDGRLKKFSKSNFNSLLDAGDPTAFKVLRNMCVIMAVRLARIEDKLVS